MKCIHCHNEIVDESNMILITIDGDFACTPECKTRYETARDKFLNETIHDDAKMEQWWKDDPQL